MISVFLIIPVIIVDVLWFRIIRIVHKSPKVTIFKISKARRKQNRNAIIQTTIVTLLFTLCYLPTSGDNKIKLFLITLKKVFNFQESIFGSLIFMMIF